QFVGKTGQFLRKHLPAGWEEKVYWQNVIRCRPPDNRLPSSQEISCCSPFLERDIQAIKPHAILGIGDIALKYFWPDVSISRVRGVPFPVKIGKDQFTWFYGTFHPSYVARSERR